MSVQRRQSLPGADGSQMRRRESSILAEETHELEKKLRHVREAMQKEMQKRDEVRHALTAGGIWGSAARPGPLQQITEDLGAPFGQSSRSRGASWAGYAAGGTKASRLPDFRIGIGPRRPPVKLPPLSPKRMSEPELQQEEPSTSQRSAKPMAFSKSGPRSPTGSTDHNREGTAGSLLEGELDEEQNRAAFLEALRAWRRGPDSQAGSSGQQSASDGEPAESTARRRPQSARPATPAVCMEVQTERPAERPATARPRTARPRTYFEKLAERQAGQLASEAVRGSH